MNAKQKQYLADMAALGVGPYTAAPPIWRLLWRMGLDLAPPAFWRWPWLLSIFGFGFATAIYFVLIAVYGDRFTESQYVLLALCAGVIFGTGMAAVTQARKPTLVSPSWRDYPELPVDIE